MTGLRPPSGCGATRRSRAGAYGWRGLLWAALLAIALSPLDPITIRWDEAVLGAAALPVLWHRLAVARRGGH